MSRPDPSTIFPKDRKYLPCARCKQAPATTYLALAPVQDTPAEGVFLCPMCLSETVGQAVLRWAGDFVGVAGVIMVDPTDDVLDLFARMADDGE